VRVALVHDWLTGMRGGERCLEVFCELFPEADLFTLVHQRGTVSPTIERVSIQTSWLQSLPWVTRYYRHLLPLFPLAIRKFRLVGYDLVLSSSHAVAKGVRRGGSPLHVCYCFTPMRYIWDQSQVYFPRERFSPVSWALLQVLFRYLRAWDVKTSRGVDEFVAISDHIAAKIQAYYNRHAYVIPPPVDCGFLRRSVSCTCRSSSSAAVQSAASWSAVRRRRSRFLAGSQMRWCAPIIDNARP
jgi:glycosyltransferase involved in cell wall biosynthesis